MFVRATLLGLEPRDRARGISALPLIINIIMVACACRVRPQYVSSLWFQHTRLTVFTAVVRSHIAPAKPVSSQVCETRDPSQSVGTTCPCT